MKKFTLLSLLALLFASSVDAASWGGAGASPQPVYQLFAILKSGLKTGYLSTTHPSFRLEGDNVRLTTDQQSIDIPLADFDYFTLEEVPVVQPTAVDLPDEQKISLGSSVPIAYVLTPDDAVTSLTWFNSNDAVVDISPEGIATAKQVGTATVTVQTSNGLRATGQVIVPEPQWQLFVKLKDDTYNAFDLSEHPEMALDGEKLVLNAGTTRVEYSIADVLEITMNDAAVVTPQGELVVSVQALAQADGTPRFRAGQVSFSNLPAGAHVRVYNGAGMLLHQAVADDRGQLSLSAARFGKGLLIVKTETSTFKILQQ